jgi:DNA polymerase I-like protein with 3'-5' exonuclease and polymerase domains
MNPPLNITLVNDEKSLSALEGYLGRVSSTGHDVETNVVNTFFHRKLRTMQFGDRNEQYVVDLLAFAGSPESLTAQQGHYGQNIGSLEPVVTVVKPFLENHDREKVGHNLQFEYEVERWCLGIRSTGFFDLLLAEKVLRAGLVHYMASDYWALDDMIARYMQLSVDKTYQTSFDLSSPLSVGQIQYGALDVRLPFAMAPTLKRMLEKEGLQRAAQIDFDAVSGFGEMHLNGLPISKNRWLERIREDEKKLNITVQRLDEAFIPVVGLKEKTEAETQQLLDLEVAWRDAPRKTPEDREACREKRMAYMELKKLDTKRRKLAKECEGKALINYGSGAQLKEALIKLGYKTSALPSTGDEVLEKLSDIKNFDIERIFNDSPDLSHLSPIDLIRVYRSLAKALDTYGYTWVTPYDHKEAGVALPGHIDPDTGRIHSKIFSLGAATGRTSSASPNVQNLPKDESYRRCFTPVDELEGTEWDTLTIDYNGCELRILSELSQDPVWLEAFRNKWDLHSVTAELVFREEWKNSAEPGCAFYAIKDKCKCARHKEMRDRVKAINFSIAYGKSAYGLAEDMQISRKEAEDVLDRWTKANPVVAAYLEKAGQSAVANLKASTLAGRVRYWKRPTWEAATTLAEKDLKKGQTLTQELIRKKYTSMFRSIEREGKNSSIQGTNADIIKRSIYLIWRDGEQYDIKQINTVHDENVLLAPKSKSKEAFEFAGRCMEDAGAEFVKSLRMTYEGHIAECWQK